MISDEAWVHATGVAVLELGERYVLKAEALLATPGLPTDHRMRLRAALDQTQAALRNLHSSTEVPHREPWCAGHPPLAASPPWPGAPALWLRPIR